MLISQMTTTRLDLDLRAFYLYEFEVTKFLI
jgi:hypothetical protein